jgi:hypothetical protein
MDYIRVPVYRLSCIQARHHNSLPVVSLTHCSSLWRGTRRAMIVSSRTTSLLQLRCWQWRHIVNGIAGGGFPGAHLINLRRPCSLPGPLAGHRHEKHEHCHNYKLPRHHWHGERWHSQCCLFWSIDRALTMFSCAAYQRMWVVSLCSMIWSAIYKWRTS